MRFNGPDKGYYYVMRAYSSALAQKQLVKVESHGFSIEEKLMAMDLKKVFEKLHPEHEFYLTFIE